MAGDWRLLALAAFLNMFSSWSGAVWNDRTLSRLITTSLVAGDVVLESTVGRGTTLEVYLPAA